MTEKAISIFEARRNKELEEEITILFKEKEEALEFILMYTKYINLVDDVVDEEGFKNYTKFLEVQAFAARVFSTSYWRQHADRLLVVEQLANSEYLDSVDWEKSDVEWKKRDANVLRHSGLNVFFAVILIEFGYDVMRRYSSKFRERCHLLQTDENFQQV